MRVGIVNESISKNRNALVCVIHQICAKIADTKIYKSVASFVKNNQESLKKVAVGAVVVAAATVGGNLVAETACIAR